MNGSRQSILRLAHVLMLCLVLLLVSSCGGDDDEAAPAPGGCTTNCPIANAGSDQTVLTGTLVALDGSQSASGTAGLLTYQWALTSRPAGSAATLSGATTVRPTLTADVAGAYTAQLVVDNGSVKSHPDTVTIIADIGNLPPRAHAGPDGAAPPGRLVTLDGNGSTDPNGTPITYRWQFLTKPPASQAVLVNPTSPMPSFTPDVAGTYKLALTVSDGTLTSPPDEVEIAVTTGQIAPVANAGPDQRVTAGHLVTLTGIGSTDPNGDPLTYNWCVRSRPDGSTATLADAMTATPTFTPDIAGFYVLCLSVNDGRAGSPFDTVVIEARPPSMQGFNGPVTTILAAQDGSGDVYVFGDFTSYEGFGVAKVVRLRPNGTHHPFTLPEAIEGNVVSIALADDGSGDVYVAELVGEFSGVSHIWKINPDGTVDQGFTVGTALIEFPRFTWRDAVHNLVSAGDHSGRVYATMPVGFIAPVDFIYNGTAVRPIVRLNPDGSLDPSFLAEVGASNPVTRIVPAQDGTEDIYVIRMVRHSPSGFISDLRRLNADGTWDTAFQAPNLIAVLFGGVSLMVPVRDGSRDLFVVGTFPNFDSPTPITDAYRGLVRMNPDGTIDLSSPKPQVEPDTAPSALSPASDGSGDWLVGSDSKVQRFHPDGTITSVFRTGEISGNSIQVITPTPDSTGDLYVGGEFSSYNGVPAGNIVRIHRDGTRE